MSFDRPSAQPQKPNTDHNPFSNPTKMPPVPKTPVEKPKPAPAGEEDLETLEPIADDEVAAKVDQGWFMTHEEVVREGREDAQESHEKRYETVDLESLDVNNPAAITEETKHFVNATFGTPGELAKFESHWGLKSGIIDLNRPTLVKGLRDDVKKAAREVQKLKPTSTVADQLATLRVTLIERAKSYRY